MFLGTTLPVSRRARRRRTSAVAIGQSAKKRRIGLPPCF
jgi:hypothetical protein